ncbi:hypothetical protein YTPLAS72_20710 [Nitrospira sp.]|nr:hypothetical protein YTPLAS72_20710 [Nitrospira sp.]
MRGPVQKTCEGCGQDFECGGYQCWCGNVGVTEQQMDWISARFKDCLCADCLNRVMQQTVNEQDLSICPKEG